MKTKTPEKEHQEKLIIDMMKSDEKSGHYEKEQNGHGGTRKNAGRIEIPKGERKKILAIYIEQDFIEELGGKKKLQKNIKEWIYNSIKYAKLSDQIKQKLIEEQKHGDAEIAHVNADGYLIELLQGLGFSDVCKEFIAIDKWYA